MTMILYMRDRKGPGLDVDPHDKGQRGDEELDSDAGGPHEDSFPFAAEGEGGRSFNIGKGGQDEEDYAKLVDLSSELFHGKGMAELMQHLEKRKYEPENDQVLRRRIRSVTFSVNSGQ